MATGEGVDDLLSYVYDELTKLKAESEDVIFESEYDPDVYLEPNDLPYEVTYDAKAKEYVVEGPKIEKMLGYTNLDSEKGFMFFQKFMKDNGILKELEAMGIQEGDTVRLYGFAFSYYKN